jgi:4-azaleucine resistance transporter AzlC
MSIDAVTFTRIGLLAGVKRTFPLALSVAAYGLAFGVIARQAGLSWIETLLMSALVNAGGSQFVAMGLWNAPPPIFTIVFTTFIVNLRHVLMGAALRAYLSKLPPWKGYSLAFFIADESWALTLSELASGGRDVAFLLGSGLTLMPAWVGSTVVGNVLGGVILDPAKWGLDFAFTAVFVALLVGMWKGRSAIAPWGVAAIVAIVAARSLPGQWYIVLGGLAGGLAGACQHVD